MGLGVLSFSYNDLISPGLAWEGLQMHRADISDRGRPGGYSRGPGMEPVHTP